MTSESSTAGVTREPRFAYLIAGAGGMLGTAMQRVLGSRGVRFVALAEREFDITDAVAASRVVHAFADSLEPGVAGVLINAAAYTNVEAAEDDEEAAFLVNARGPVVLAQAARETGLGFVHISTDFVFDGCKPGAYTEDDDPNPLSVYGASKLAGELAVRRGFPAALVVRTAWVFGPGGANFPVKILEAAKQHSRLPVVNDEVGSPTFTIDLARGIIGLMEAGAQGLFHLAGAGTCTRVELAEATIAHAGLSARIEPVAGDGFPTKARRPSNSVLDCAKAAGLGVTMPDWTDALARFMSEIT